MGAISAASRRNRRGTGASKSPFGSSSSFTVPTLKQVPICKENPISDTVSVDSKPSVLSMFKQQVQETGGFFKKTQQALAEKVQKGIKMTSNLTSGQKKEPAEKKEDGIDPAWVSSLEQMGFEASKIHEAAAMLGAQPEHMDDLLQVLVTMHSSSDPASASEPPVTPAAAPAPVASFAVPAPVANLPKTATKELCNDKSSSIAVPRLGPMHPPTFHVQFPARSAVGSGSAEYELAADNYDFTRSLSPQNEGLSHSAFVSLQQMGFAPGAIDQAVNILGKKSSFEDLFDILLAMGSPLSPPNSGGASSSTDGLVQAKLSAAAASEPTEEAQNATAAALVAEMVREELGSLDEIQDVESQSDDPETVYNAEPGSPSLVEEELEQPKAEDEAEEPSSRALAAASIASAIARHFEQIVEVKEVEAVATQPKHAQLEGNLCASPVRGGA